MIVIEWYVLRTASGKEQTALTILHKLFSAVEVIYPRKRISWRKQGSIINLVRPLFNGYLFISSTKEKIGEFDQLLRRCNLNFAWLLYTTGSLLPIMNEEKQLIQKLIGNNGIAEMSTVEKYDNQLQVVSGPLVGLEHIVTKVSRRNRRITVEISVLDEKRKVELEGDFITN